MRKQAKTMTDEQLAKLFAHVDQTSVVPERDKLIFLLSFGAGLRAAEIAKLDLSSLTDADGNIAKTIHVPTNVGKKKRSRDVPMNKEVAAAVRAFRLKYPGATFVAFSSQPFRFAKIKPLGQFVPEYRRMSPNTVVVYMREVMKQAGFDGCSSHSGRRTFGTRMARMANQHHCSLRDVQKLLGHARLDTTERYVEVSDDARSLVDALFA